MLVRDIMTCDLKVLPPTATVAQAAQEMKLWDCGMIPICEGPKLVGLITDRDITVRAAAAGLDPRTTLLQDVMSHEDLVYCYEDERVEDVARAMSDHQVRRVPVLDQRKHLVGVVSLGDLANMTHDRSMVAEVLDEISEPPRHV